MFTISTISTAKLDDASRRYLAKNRDRAEKGETHEERLTQHLMDLRLAWLKDGDNDETPHLDRALETMKMTINLKKQGSNLSRLHHNRRVIMMIFDLFNWGSEFRASGYLKVTTIAKKLIGSSGGVRPIFHRCRATLIFVRRYWRNSQSTCRMIWLDCCMPWRTSSTSRAKQTTS
jgi:hypothetical protein